MNARLGRPPSDNPRTKTARVRLTPAEHEALRAIAEADGAKDVSGWVRAQAAKRAKRLGIDWPKGGD